MKHVIIILLAFVLLGQTAQANLLVSPTRLAFEGKDRVKDLVLINVSDKPRSYRIEWQENRTNERGKYIAIAQDDLTFASSEFIRYSPRQVSLQPGERQVIKLMLRRKGNMTLAEYRSHLKVTALPPETSEAEKKLKTEKSGIGFKIDVLTSYTLPVIVRTKPADARVTIDSVSINVDQSNQASFEIDLRKRGDSSVSGELNIFLTPDGMQEQRVGILRGVNIFHENPRRLSNVRWLDYTGPITGTLRVEYIGGDEFTGKVLANYEMQVNLNAYNALN